MPWAERPLSCRSGNLISTFRGNLGRYTQIPSSRNFVPLCKKEKCLVNFKMLYLALKTNFLQDDWKTIAKSSLQPSFMPSEQRKKNEKKLRIYPDSIIFPSLGAKIPSHVFVFPFRNLRKIPDLFTCFPGEDLSLLSLSLSLFFDRAGVNILQKSDTSKPKSHRPPNQSSSQEKKLDPNSSHTWRRPVAATTFLFPRRDFFPLLPLRSFRFSSSFIAFPDVFLWSFSLARPF